MNAPVAVPRIYQAWAFALHGGTTLEDSARLEQGHDVLRERLGLRLRRPCARVDLRAFLGPTGGRFMLGLYMLANDPPFWRSSPITVRADDLLDALGFMRSRQGYHYSHARRRLRGLLDALDTVEVAFPGRTASALAAIALPARGLPRELRIHLAFYEGVRRRPGELGTDYVLVPRPTDLRRGRPTANTLLAGYLLARRRQVGRSELLLREELLIIRAGIRDRRAGRARARLRVVLERLVKEGVLLRYSCAGRGATAVCSLELPAPEAVSARARLRAYGG